ncbi:MAG: type II toxin-antitoxin system VapC family toxin [bacterium]
MLIDTSAWVHALKKQAPRILADLVRQIVLERRGATTGMIILELLGGVRTEHEYRALSEELNALQYLPTDSAWPHAWRLSFELRRHGVKVPSADLLIASVAIEHDCTLFHADEHFSLVQRYTRLSVQEAPIP